MGFTDAVRELQVLKEDELWEHRLVSHISFSFSILFLQHSSKFRFLKSSPCLQVPFSRFPFFIKYLCISAPLLYHREFFIHSWMFRLYFVSSSSCHTLLALSCYCVVPDSSQRISSWLLAQL